MEKGQQPTPLRIAGYVGSVPKHAKREDDQPRTALPNIADYWPDVPESAGATWHELLPDSARQSVPGEPGTGGRSWIQRPVILTGMTALLVVFGTVLLARPLATSEITERPAAVPTGVIPLEPMPAASPSPSFSFALPPTTPAAASSPSPSRPAPVKRTARLEFVTGVTTLTVRITDLGDDDFRVSGPSQTTFSGGVLRVDAGPAGGGDVEIRLSSRITWHLRLGAGVKTMDFDATAGTVSRIDLDGGAETMNLRLGRLAGVVPVRMTGGVGAWFIHTRNQIPVRVRVGSGAGNVTLYGRASGGVGGGTALGADDLGRGPALDIDAPGGIGSLEVKRRQR
ncbi:hypothetical protein [Actinoplanes sp. G11-F43]|uniref:hypothetical protein n=1 Tax=Actinoplanes sp. G11-F43 TaxID=3424130 RepID=UPI003D3284A5